MQVDPYAQCKRHLGWEDGTFWWFPICSHDLGDVIKVIEAIDRYGSSNCFEVSMAYRGPAFFFLGGGTKVFYIFNILDALYKLDTYYNMFDHV